MRLPNSFLILFVALAAGMHAEDADELARTSVLDFEKAVDVQKYPKDRAGEVAVSKDWKSGGEQSLKIDAKLMASFENLKVKDWSSYTLLRMRFKNSTDQAIEVGFELQDENKTYVDRHQNGFGIEPGERTIEIYFTGGLWRGEENRPYRGLKTPLNIGNITRMSITNEGDGSIYLDDVEVVRLKPLSLPGGHAFDFGKSNTQVMFNFQGVNESTEYTKARGFGLLGGSAFALNKSMSFPTPLLGDGLSWPDGFRVDLPDGGSYLGWIAFERGGFWESEQSGYSKCTLSVNGATVHEHEFSALGTHFTFQDTEITDTAQVVEKLIWPAHAISSFKFNAEKGGNTFKLDVKDPSGTKLRVAGLIIAPDSAEGRAFIDAHEKQQRKVIATTFTAQDRGRRGAGRVEPEKNFVCVALPPGEMMYPRDWPTSAGGSLPEEILAVSGQTVTVHLGLYARKTLNLNVAADGGTGPGKLPPPTISHGRYMPQRNYGVGSMWLTVNHYRPENQFVVSPDVARSVVAEFEIPRDAKAGLYSSVLQIAGDGESLSVPVSIRVASVRLEPIPIPVGVFMNALAFGPNGIKEDDWWTLQESLLKEQSRAGLNTLTGGAGLDLKFEGGKITGANALKFIKLGVSHGMDKAIVPYGGFLPGIRNFKGDIHAFAAAVKAFETDNALPPMYVKAFDEPGTPEEKKQVLQNLKAATDAGLRTIGYTSEHWGDEFWENIIKTAHSPAFNIHQAAVFKRVKDFGGHPWVYNNDRDRYGWGVNLWRQIKLGCEGRVDWIGNYTQGFAFHNLDGREPSVPFFMCHEKFGVMVTPMWLSGREGLLDLRLRLTLEKAVPADDPVLALWGIDNYRKDKDHWTHAEMEKVRRAMIERLEKTGAK